MAQMEGCRLPNLFTIGSYKISSKELRSLLEIIQAQFFLICAAWKQHFKTDSIKFYC